MTVFELTLLGVVLIIIAAAGFWIASVLDDDKADLSFLDDDQPRDYEVKTENDSKTNLEREPWLSR
jgi:hypothetical protein